MRSPIPEGLSERLYGVAVLVLAITLIVWLNLPKLLWPAFILALVLLLIGGIAAFTRGRRANGETDVPPLTAGLRPPFVPAKSGEIVGAYKTKAGRYDIGLNQCSLEEMRESIEDTGYRASDEE